MKENMGDYFPSRFLKADDIAGEMRLTIAAVQEEVIGDGAKPVVYFRECGKGLVLNVTNALKISKMAGSKRLADWTGIRIALYAALVTYRGEEVPAIRVRECGQEGAPAPARTAIDEAMEEAGKEGAG